MARPQTKEDKDRFFANLEQLGESDTETATATESEDEELDLDAPYPFPPFRRSWKPASNSRTTVHSNHGVHRSGQTESIASRPHSTASSCANPVPAVIDLTSPAAPITKSSYIKLAPTVVDLTSPSAPTDDSGVKFQFNNSAKSSKKRLYPEDVKAPPRKSAKKSKDDIVLVSEEKQIFKDLVFFFVPNDNIGKVRQVRTKLTQEYGGRRASVFDSSVTHVLVEGHIEYKELPKAFPNRIIPDGTVIAQFSWFSQSIASGWLRDITQSRFRLKGQPPLAGANPLPLPITPQVPPKRSSHDMSTTPRRPSNSPEMNKELEEIMALVKNSHNLPLAWDDEDIDSFHSANGAVDDKLTESSNKSELPKQVPQANKGFQCMQANTGERDSNPNLKTITVLREMAKYYDRTGDHWRTTAYRKAITALSKQSSLIATQDQALKIPQIGTRLADKIEEIVTTNRLRRLETTKHDPSAEALQLYMGIYDVGLTQASKWVAQGYRTLKDLVDKAELTSNQRTGIEHYHDFQLRIPRTEVCKHALIVRKACQTVDKELQVIVGGSYRRGSADSGDIDLVITKPGAGLTQIRTLLNSQVIPALTKAGFLKCALAASTSKTQSGSKWLGVSCLPASTTWRRIDLLFVPGDELGAALLYFTGNDIYNRSMRLLASKKGMRLNQHGLYKDVMRGPGRVKMTEGTLVESQDEKRIFEILGVPWREPHERQC